MRSHHPFLWLALVLVGIWFLLKFVFAIAGGVIHLLWLGVLVFLGIWLFRHFTGGRTPRV